MMERFDFGKDIKIFRLIDGNYVDVTHEIDEIQQLIGTALIFSDLCSARRQSAESE